MRSHLVLLILLSMLFGMNVLAAPAPRPSAILDIGPPPKGTTVEKYRKWEIRCLKHPRGMLNDTWCDTEVKKLPSISGMKDPRPWLSENLEISPVSGSDRLLRIKFRAGNSAEQVVIINTLLRINMRLKAQRIKSHEKGLRIMEAGAPRTAKLMKEERNVSNHRRYQKEWVDAKVCEEETHAEIFRLKQITVKRWAK